jgi:4-carboxymuconolactone decarboxylase
MSRLPAPDPKNDAELAEVFGEIKASRGFVSNALTSLGHAPSGLKHLARWGEYVKYRTDLPERLRELCILTSARGVPYAWSHHEALAVQTGIAKEAVDDIGKGRVPSALPGNEQAIVRFIFELMELKVSDATFAAIRKHFSPRQVTDIAMSATYYSALGRMILAFGVNLENPEVLQVERDWQKGR